MIFVMYFLLIHYREECVTNFIFLYSDKLLMHIMVLILHLNDGVINMAIFSKVRLLYSERVCRCGMGEYIYFIYFSLLFLGCEPGIRQNHCSCERNWMHYSAWE